MTHLHLTSARARSLFVRGLLVQRLVRRLMQVNYWRVFSILRRAIIFFRGELLVRDATMYMLLLCIPPGGYPNFNFRFDFLPATCIRENDASCSIPSRHLRCWFCGRSRGPEPWAIHRSRSNVSRASASNIQPFSQTTTFTFSWSAYLDAYLNAYLGGSAFFFSPFQRFQRFQREDFSIFLSSRLVDGGSKCDGNRIA